MNNYSMSTPYPQAQSAQIRPEVNAVKIELINPQAYGTSPEKPQMAPVSDMYAYPQNSIYPAMAAPMGPIQNLAPMPFMPQQPLMANPMASVPEPPVANFAPITPEKKAAPIAFVDTPSAMPKAKEASETLANKPDAMPEAKEATPAIDLKPIIGSLKSDDMDQQFMAIQQVAELGQNPKVPSDTLLNEEVFSNLKGIISKDTSNMPGPTAEQETLRNKKFSGEKLTKEQDALAETLAPQEVAEMNKMFATYALAITQKNFRESVNKEASKQGLEPVKLNEIPEMETVVNNIKSNPNPLIREASISALAYVAQPEDKETVSIILSTASNDPDPMVKEAANKAQDKINKK